jgi:uncharacterized RDD family membrane protein YckC
VQVSYRATFTDATRPAANADRVSTIQHKHEVQLPENVKAAFEVASPLTRVIAFVVDLGVMILLNILLFLVLVFLLSTFGFSQSGNVAVAFMLIGFFIVNVGYFFIWEGFFSGLTVGKQMCKLRVIREDGQEIGPREGIIRAFVRLAILGPLPVAIIFVGVDDPTKLFMVAPFAALAAVMFIDRKSRGVADFIAGTYVIRQAPNIYVPNRPYVPPYFYLDHHFFPLNAAEMQRLTPDDYVKLEEFGARLSTISSEARREAAMAAAAALAGRMKYSKPVEPEYAEVFLFEMHAALKQQLQQLYPDLYA